MYNIEWDVSYMTIFNFCENQFVLNDTTLAIQKYVWPQKRQNLCFSNVYTTSD